MTRDDLADMVCERWPSFKNRDQARLAIDAVLDSIPALVGRYNKPLQITGFGTFFPRASRARTITTPVVGSPVDVPARRKLAFRTRQTLGDRT